MLRRAIDVGAKVEHVNLAFHGWQYAGDGRTVYPGQRLEHESRNRHQRAGVAGADAGVRFAALDQVDGDAHGRVLLSAQSQRGRLVHAHCLCRVVHAQMRTRRGVARAQFGIDRFLQTHQNESAMRMGFLEIERGGNDHARAVIASHAIDGYRGVHLIVRGSQGGNRPGLPPGEGARYPFALRQASLFAFGLDDFLATIIAAGADMVAQMHFARGRFHGQGRVGEKVMGAMHAALRR